MGGLPRSGSTLLQSILQQNPKVHASQNSVLLPLLWNIWDCYEKEEPAKAFSVDTQLEKTMWYAAHGFYAHIQKPIIIDKSRGWGHNIGVIKKVFPENTKFIATVRSIPDILASFVTLANNNKMNYIDQTLYKQGIQNISNKDRCEWLVSKSGTLFESWDSFRFAWDNFRDNICVVEYDTLLLQPQKEMDRIYDFIGVDTFHHNFSNIINQTPENDSIYGIAGMHDVRKQLTRSSINPISILGEDLYHQYNGGHFWRE